METDREGGEPMIKNERLFEEYAQEAAVCTGCGRLGGVDLGCQRRPCGPERQLGEVVEEAIGVSLLSKGEEKKVVI